MFDACTVKQVSNLKYPNYLLLNSIKVLCELHGKISDIYIYIYIYIYIKSKIFLYVNMK